MFSTQVQNRSTSGLVGPTLLRALTENWWLLLLRGVAAIVFGILALVWPGLTLVSLTYLWGAYALADGILLGLWAAMFGKASEAAQHLWLAIASLTAVLPGVLAFASPGITAQVLLILIASWAIIIGALQIWAAIQLRKEIEGEWLLVLDGLFSIVFGVALTVLPSSGALAVVWLVGLFAILTGCSYIAFAFWLERRVHPT